MSQPIIEIENLSKLYRLGTINARTFRDSLSQWWERRRTRGGSGVKASKHRFSPDQRGPDENTFWALHDVSFKVEAGEVVGVIGRNGAGKSTLLKILSRITEPTHGRAVLRGRVASLLEIGTGFHPDLSGRDNIFLNGAILGMKVAEIRRKFDEIVDFSGVGPFIDTPVKRYSSGMYVRLAFAVAAHLEPDILFVDEVLAVGDNEFQRKCIGKMEGVAREGRTVFFVSHNMVAVSELCAECLWLDRGRLRQKGPTAEVVNAYTRTASGPVHREFDPTSLSGDGRVELLSYVVHNERGETTAPPVTSEDVNILIRMRVKEPLRHPACGVSIWNQIGVLMTSINSVEQGLAFEPLPEGECEWTVRLGRVSYLPGLYHMSFWVMNPECEIHALAEGAISFEVGQRPLYGTRTLDHRYGCVYTEISHAVRPGTV